MKLHLALVPLSLIYGQLLAEPLMPTPLPPSPTLADVHYGDHPRQVLDFYRADSDRPTPVVFFLHGGAWMNGDKRGAIGPYYDIPRLLAAGISVVSINYRYVSQAREAGVKPPVSWPMADGARALQFVRSKTAEWNMDPQRIAGSGGSAGACTVLWLALHPDLADPTSSDPIARQSTHFFCVAVDVAQTSLDPQQLKEWIPNSRYGAHAFGFTSPKDVVKNEQIFQEFLARRDEFLPWIKEYSPIEHASAAAPSIYMFYKAPPALGMPQKDPTHSANFGVKLQEKLKSLGAECELNYPGAPDVRHATIEAFLIDKLKK